MPEERGKYIICDGCRKEFDTLWEHTPEGQWLCKGCADTYHESDPYWDDPCIENGHDWVGGDYADDCLVCRVCGIYDC